MLRSLATRSAQLRGLHTTQAMRLDPRTVEEVKIPVPWGHIAGKWWGRKEGTQLIVAVHGWLDNANSFDPVVEKLPDDHSVLAVDMPGNGQSSHYSPFMNYTYVDTPATIKRVVNFVNRKVHLLGHSGGSATCFLFSAAYPEDVLSYCGVDFLCLLYNNEASRVSKMGKEIDAFIYNALQDPKKSKPYAWEEVKIGLIAATQGSLTPDTAEILMQRGVKKLPNGKVVLTSDNRFKSKDMNLIRPNQLEALVQNYNTHTCLIRAKQSRFFFDVGIKHFPEVLDIMKKQCSIYEFLEIDGTHHVHMDKPSEIAEMYLNFLKKVQEYPKTAKSLNQHCTVLAYFINFEKAFDSVKLVWDLEEAGLDCKHLILIRLHWWQTAQVRVDGALLEGETVAKLVRRKWWGDRNVRPILALHGLLDNCATFDRLLPLVNAESVLAIDLPGHGLSSHIGPGLIDNFPNVLSSVRYLVKRHFQWPKVDFLGHSFGSCISFVYSGLYPQTVGKFISLDCARFNMARQTTSPALLLVASDRALNTPEPPEESYHEQLERFMESRRQHGYPLTEAASKILLTRSLRQTSPGKYVETPDQRLPVYLGLFPIPTLDQLASSITCEVLAVRATGGVLKGAIKEAYDRHIAVMKNNSPNLVSVDVNGGHHAHLETPESVAPCINSFLL